MTGHGPEITICICTYRRPEWLRRLLLSLQQQQTNGLFSYSIVIADNDGAESARDLVTELAGHSVVPLTYCAEPRRNFALVRDKALQFATGDWIAFIDDDEVPVDDWLLDLYQACAIHRADGALGPVRPRFEETPPAWVRKSGLYDRPDHPTGFVMSWRESRTGNVLFRRGILPVDGSVFDPQFATGGEDQDFFRRMIAQGHRFVWCNEAVVYETVSPIRWDKKVMIQRALLRGKNSLRHSRNRTRSLVKSAIAIPAYALLLPLLALAGTHVYMRYLVKLCDHLGKVLAAIGLNWVRERRG